jgi:hypothetical protein
VRAFAIWLRGGRCFNNSGAEPFKKRKKGKEKERKKRKKKECTLSVHAPLILCWSGWCDLLVRWGVGGVICHWARDEWGGWGGLPLSTGWMGPHGPDGMVRHRARCVSAGTRSKRVNYSEKYSCYGAHLVQDQRGLAPLPCTRGYTCWVHYVMRGMGSHSTTPPLEPIHLYILILRVLRVLSEIVQ